MTFTPTTRQVPAVQSSTKSSNIPEVTLSVRELPSKGLTYPEGGFIKYRPYSFGEVKKTSGDKNISTKDGFLKVLEGVECNFDKNILTVSDVLYIGLLRKLSTLGSVKVTVPYKCESCSTENREVINTQELEFEDIKFDRSNQFPVIAELSTGTYQFKPLTISAFFNAIDAGKGNDEVGLIAACCVSHSFENSYKVVDGALGEDAEIINEVDSLLYHGLKPVPSKCRKCGNIIQIELDGGQALVLPFRETRTTARNRIRFGSETPHQPG